MRFHFPRWSLPIRRAESWVLASAVILGCLVGLWLSPNAWEQLPDVLPMLSDGASLPGRTAVLLLPLLLSGGAVYGGRPLILLPIAFWNCLAFSYVYSGLSFSWDGSGWLIGSLGMLPSLLALPVLYWYWLRHLDGKSFDPGSFLAAGAWILAIAMADVWVISPFLSNIITF